MKPDFADKMKTWLMSIGSDVLASTNPYELVRFKAKGGTHVIYQRANGRITAKGVAAEALDAFNNNKPFDVGLIKTKSMANFKQKSALVARDGMDCFYCGLRMDSDDITAEHLIARNKGGQNKLENMALAHQKCNQLAGHIPLIEKIKLRERLRKENNIL